MKISTPYLQARMSAPDAFKESVLNFFRANDLKVSLSKQIAPVQFYDQKTVATLTRQQFFYGAYNAGATNLENTYTRPEAEHAIITAIRIADGNAAVVNETDWNIGANLVGTKNGVFSVDVNGTTVLNNFPSGGAVDDLTDEARGMIYLPEPILWAGQTTLKLDYVQPAAGAANDNLRFELHGLALIS